MRAHRISLVCAAIISLTAACTKNYYTTNNYYFSDGSVSDAGVSPLDATTTADAGHDAAIATDAGCGSACDSWHTELVDHTTDTSSPRGQFTSIALDAHGHAHIAYNQTPRGDIQYDAWTGTTWNFQDLGDGIQSASLALDSSGNPHISYVGGDFGSGTTSLVKYASWNGSSWDIQTVDTIGILGTSSAYGANTSLALDASGNAHISYIAIPSSSISPNVKHAEWNGSSWTIQTVGSAGSGTVLGGYTSIALDASGNPSITWVNFNGEIILDGGVVADAVQYAARTGSSTWHVEAIEAVAPTSTGNTSLALDASGNPHVTYFGAGGWLKYASKMGSNWAIQSIDASSGEFNSLALDTRGTPHIAYYYSNSSYALKYATWSGTAWVLQTIDSSSSVATGEFPSLALDSHGAPFISYFQDGMSGGLKYAWFGQ